MSSFTTIRWVYSLPAAQPAILPISKPFPFFRLMSSAPGKIETISSQNSYVTLVAFCEAVIRTLGGIDGSASPEK